MEILHNITIALRDPNVAPVIAGVVVFLIGLGCVAIGFVAKLLSDMYIESLENKNR